MEIENILETNTNSDSILHLICRNPELGNEVLLRAIDMIREKVDGDFDKLVSFINLENLEC